MLRCFALVLCAMTLLVACAPRSETSTLDSSSSAQDNLFPIPLSGDSLNEIVMSPGMEITATTSFGTIKIFAPDELTRSYTWEGATRSVVMLRRAERWYGSLGLYYPGPGEHWRDHGGIRRCVVEEGIRHFESVEEAVEWLQEQSEMWNSYFDLPPETQIYAVREDGLVVGWSKQLARRQLNVGVWQFYVQGRRPSAFPGPTGSIVVRLLDQ